MRFIFIMVILLPLLKDPNDKRLQITDFGQYSIKKFSQDLLSFNDGNPLTEEQKTLISKSYETTKWLSTNGIKFEPIYKRQSFQKNGKYVFWGYPSFSK